MTRRIALMAATALLGAILLYLSQFWWLDLWPRQGLLGVAALRPDGDVLSRWLRGTMAAPFATLLWVIGAFVVLTWAQGLIDLFWPEGEDDHD